ncbi:transcription factor bHLH93 [Magnolia sinica]|uniref:transcription factor bHLH93 n=1 Tax=Magnolia sinica TaxID=86752 RepID=UPI002657FD8D|nr:transcription factor bHLH93 [Magnolia sinica]
MELDEHGFLEELLALRRDTWEGFPIEMSDIFNHGGSFDSFQDNPNLVFPFSSCDSFGFSTSTHPTFDSSLNEVYCPYVDTISSTQIDPSPEFHDPIPFPTQEDCPSIIEDDDLGLLASENLRNSDDKQRICKVEMSQSAEIPVFDVGSCLGRKSRVKKVEGQPSKNLMAERRRRKRLNDRLSMLRSVVPKISKMDRTSILGDTIDYMKELLDRIKKLQEEIQGGSNQLNLLSIFKELTSNEILVRNTPKFDVERRNADTRIDICCATKPGLLLSTIATLEALGLEIQQCVISCFNDFGMQASCSEDLEQRPVVNSEEIKQALFRNAGYGGRCM